MKKLTVIFFLALLFLCFNVSTSFAATQTLSVTCSSSCTKSGTDPLFSKTIDGVWYPGLSITKTISLTNASSDNKEMAMKASRTSPSSLLEQVMTVEISNPATSQIVWTGKLVDFYTRDKISFGTVSPGEQKDFYMKAAMDSLADNTYQALESVFDLRLGFWTEESNSQNGNGGGGSTSTTTSSTSHPSTGQVLSVQTGTSPQKGEVLGEELGTKKPIVQKQKGIFSFPGGASGQCKRLFLPLLLMLFLPLIFILRALKKQFKKRKTLLSERIFGAAGIIAAWLFVCPVWQFVLCSTLVYACMLALFMFHKRED